MIAQKITRLSATVSVLLGAALISCSTPTKPLSTSSLIPAGKGSIRARTDSNQNTTLEIAVNHLAPPERVSESATSYVVWAEPVDRSVAPQNLGALSIDKNLNGNLQTVTPFRTFNLFVTAEPSALVVQPSGERMLWGEVFNGVAS